MTTHPAPSFHLRDQDLTAADLAHYRQQGAIALDTETMGLNPWRDRLCLVQLCDGTDYLTVIRITQGQRQAPHLQELLETKTVTKVFHFARFDLAMVRHHLGIDVAPIFCTKIASKLARTYTPRHGLKDLVMELVKVELDKSSQSSDWGNADQLSPEQLCYAANDVRHLLAVQQILTTMLQREGRWQLAQQCFECLPTLIQLDLLQYQGIFDH